MNCMQKETMNKITKIRQTFEKQFGRDLSESDAEELNKLTLRRDINGVKKKIKELLSQT